MKKGNPFVATDPSGKVHQGIGLKGFCQLYKLHYQDARDSMNGVMIATRDGWTFGIPEPDVDTSDWKHHKTTGKPPKGAEKELIDQLLNEDGNIDILMRRTPDIAEAILELQDVDPKRCCRNLHTLIMRLSMGVAGGKKLPDGCSINTMLSAAKEMAKAHGIDWSDIADRRSDTEKAADLIDRLARLGPQELLCEFDEELDALEAAMDYTEEVGDKIYDKLNDPNEPITAAQILPIEQMPEGQDPGAPPGPKAIAAAVQNWRVRVRRVRELARRARHRSDPEARGKRRRVQEATHQLRFQVYVNRSERNKEQIQRRAQKVFVFDAIHVQASMYTYFARGGYARTKFGLLAPGDRYGPVGYEIVFEGVEHRGVIILMPPRHGKTEGVIADIVLAIGENPEIQMGTIHDNEKVAERTLASVASCFDKNTEQGRRNNRLFPYELDAKDNNAQSIRVKTKNRPKNPNLIAAGIFGGGLGNNLDRLYPDDVVPEKDRREPTRREARKQAYRTTWLTRDQGLRGYITLTGYPHHHKDLVWDAVLEAKKYQDTEGREGVPMWVMRAPVGGPIDKPGIPKFMSISKLYPKKWLKGKYAELGDRHMWAANYELDPQPLGTRIVEEIELFNVDSPETRRFLDRAEHMMCVDPTSTKDPKTSDMVGLVLGAYGDRSGLSIDEMGNEHAVPEPALYMTQEMEFLANQPEIAKRMIGIADSRHHNRLINQAIVEVTGPGHALVDFLEDLYGINNVYQAKANNLNKGERFRAVAGLIENSDPQNAPPCVCFPGRHPIGADGNPDYEQPLVLLPEFERLYNYIVNFKNESGLHSLDAMVHLIKFCKDNRSLGRGRGAFSRQAMGLKKSPPGSILKKNYALIHEGRTKATPRSAMDPGMQRLNHTGV